jgi:hypothetical protein
VLLSATIQDITATAEAAGDTAFGDIRNAMVEFVNHDTGSKLCTGLVPALVNPGDTKTGTVSCSTTLSVDSTGSKQYTVRTVVYKYYMRDTSFDDTVVTVSQQLAGSVTGGGYIVNQASAGQYAGTIGAKSNFGFNVKNNKTGKNLQGHVNLIIRKMVDGVWRTYQIKTTATDTLSENITSPTTGTATFAAKAGMTDITNPLVAVPISGSFIIQFMISDNGEPAVNDAISWALWNGSTLVNSSNWNGVKTVEQILGGGNLQVR